MPRLVLPHSRYKRSYLEALREFQAEGLGHYAKLSYHSLRFSFSAFLRRLHRQRYRMDEPGKVPRTEFWLVEKGEYLGRVVIRQQLTGQLKKIGGHITYDIRPSQRRRGLGTKALALGLKKAKNVGLRQVLLTCDETNLGSRRIIEKNGGQLESIRRVIPGEPKKMYFWITLLPTRWRATTSVAASRAVVFS